MTQPAYGFRRAVIPRNERNSAGSNETKFNEFGAPLCPKDKTPLKARGFCGGKNRSGRLKFICPKAKKSGSTLRSACENPCTPSKYPHCVYVYPDKDLRLYPGISRDDPEFAVTYKHRAAVERSIASLKTSLCLDGRKTSNVLTTKADLFLAGITQLLCVLLAGRLNDHSIARRTRILLAA